MFYSIERRGDGLVDVWLTPGRAVPFFENNGHVEVSVRTLGVCGVDPDDPQWGGDLDEHIQAHYYEWLARSEEIEI